MFILIVASFVRFCRFVNFHQSPLNPVIWLCAIIRLHLVLALLYCKLTLAPCAILLYTFTHSLCYYTLTLALLYAYTCSLYMLQNMHYNISLHVWVYMWHPYHVWAWTQQPRTKPKERGTEVHNKSSTPFEVSKCIYSHTRFLSWNNMYSTSGYALIN